MAAVHDSSHSPIQHSSVRRWADHGLYPLLHDREIGDYQRAHGSVRTTYGHPHWINNLDIVNELGGHSGCVNALSWSKSGRLLASGSDDKHLNIQRYQPDDANAQFSLATTVATGHTANIFSVKFMPQSNDQTVVTAAGDGEVRVFDIEHSGQTTRSSTAADMAIHARRRGRGVMYDGVRYMTDGNTNCRVYRSHGDRVKRIVTESSPHLFLTCSEDGEVRQWDLRQPSSAYPRPRRGTDDGSVPPPLISYKRYELDLNTISCSPSQPYYIALGGAHLHCFLHDRRMLGRDKRFEQGNAGPGSAMSDDGGDLLGEATRCVRKFAPNGQRRMRRTDNGHITACKISDANPNEMVVSWSGEHIYSFDLLRSPDASQLAAIQQSQVKNERKNQLKQNADRKRKRAGGSSNSLSHQGVARAESRQRTEEAEEPSARSEEMALRVQYGNGQTEDIPLQNTDAAEEVTKSSEPSTPRHRLADDLSRRTLRLRSSLFETRRPRPPLERDPTGYATTFTSVLGFSASILPEMKDIHSAWQYPVEPEPDELVIHRKLRKSRESAIRFVQAAGVVSRALGGKLQSASSTNPAISMFETVEPLSNEGPDFAPVERFRYDFLRAIFLWLDSGVGAVIQGFSKNSSSQWRVNQRFPIPQDSGVEAIEEHLIPYLLKDATSEPVVNLDTSRFEVDENRVVFSSEQEAVREFGKAIAKPFADLSLEAESSDEETQSRQTALRFWGMTVARGILKNAFESLSFEMISRAFGGLGIADTQTRRTERVERLATEEVDLGEEDSRNVASASMQIVGANDGNTESMEMEPVPVSDVTSALLEAENMAVDMQSANGQHDEEEEEEEEDEDDFNDDSETSDSEDEDDEDVEDEADEDDGEAGFGLPRHVFRSAFDRRRLREKVDEDVPCVSHTRVYRGHCNVKTVKDVNFFGLQDEYVVSGSDDGNLFIWDRKTSKLVNILEGDGEVVNVIQGHPYEPMLAVSGIDDTIKIFSADARARLMARLGRGVEAADASSFSSLSWPARIRGRRVVPRRSSTVTSEPAIDEAEGQPSIPDDEDDETVEMNGLSSRKRINLEYQITSENDSHRQGGNQEAYITRSMLAQLAASIRRQRAEGGQETNEHELRVGGRTGRLVISDDCIVM